ncbi:MAG: PTS sugar transporter subunit IIA [Chitinivibrionales bacterium]|nr:PTS sugar transporter subunit IIA [Chitinivibrionales bacterium]
MAFQNYLKIPTIVELSSGDKVDALKEIIAALAKALDIRKQKTILEELLKREEAASTFIGQGVAIPHSRMALKEPFAIAVGRSRTGIKYDAARNALAYIIVLVLIREDVESAAHIGLLAELATFFKADATRQQILSAESPADLAALANALKPLTDEKSGKKKYTSPILSGANALAREIKASAIMIFADTVHDNEFLDYFKAKSKLIVVTSNKSRFDENDKRLLGLIQVPAFPTSRTGQIKIGILLALSRNLISKEDRIVCISGNSKAGFFDTVMMLDINTEFDFFFTATQAILPQDVKPEVLERVLGLAAEIAIEGREGKPIGTIFVLGDTNSVNVYARQLIINPFRGYSEAERSILDPGLDETIKEFSSIDGAFIVTGDGIVISAGSYLRPQAEIDLPPSGFGARHAAAAGITACTKALAIAVSESTGMVTLFKNGAIVMTLTRPVARGKSTIVPA